jgi:hypothetical protein
MIAEHRYSAFTLRFCYFATKAALTCRTPQFRYGVRKDRVLVAGRYSGCVASWASGQPATGDEKGQF